MLTKHWSRSEGMGGGGGVGELSALLAPAVQVQVSHSYSDSHFISPLTTIIIFPTAIKK